MTRRDLKRKILRAVTLLRNPKRLQIGVIRSNRMRELRAGLSDAQRAGVCRHLFDARVDRRTEYADHEQRDTKRSIQPVILESHARQHIHALYHNQQKRWNAKESKQ